MTAINQEYEVVKIDGDFDVIREHPDNPNRGDEAVIDESIDVNGWYGAVTAQKSTGYIVAGNHRYRVAKAKGMKEIPVIWKDVDDESALRIMLADNQTARRADPDEEKLTALLQSLPDLGGTGYDSALSPLEQAIESGKETLADGKPRDLTPGPGPDNGIEPEAGTNGDGPSHVPDTPTADNVPDDVYTPQYGVIIICTSEEDQEGVYELCKKTFGEQDIQVRLTAV
jgi:hypothetical protein